MHYDSKKAVLAIRTHDTTTPQRPRSAVVERWLKNRSFLALLKVKFCYFLASEVSPRTKVAYFLLSSIYSFWETAYLDFPTTP